MHQGVARGSEAPFGETRQGIHPEIEVGLVAQVAQRAFEARARDRGPPKIERQVERLLVEPVNSGHGLRIFSTRT